jgi:hypothetical protein
MCAAALSRVTASFWIAAIALAALVSEVIALHAFWWGTTARPVWAFVLGSLAVAGSAFWIAVSMAARRRNPVLNAWASIFGPLGAVQFLAGMTLILWYAAAPDWLVTTAAGLAASSLAASWALRRGQTPGGG